MAAESLRKAAEAATDFTARYGVRASSHPPTAGQRPTRTQAAPTDPAAANSIRVISCRRRRTLPPAGGPRLNEDVCRAPATHAAQRSPPQSCAPLSPYPTMCQSNVNGFNKNLSLLSPYDLLFGAVSRAMVWNLAAARYVSRNSGPAGTRDRSPAEDRWHGGQWTGSAGPMGEGGHKERRGQKTEGKAVKRKQQSPMKV